MTSLIALTGQYTEAILMSSFLTEEGLHPAPIQQQMQVTALGGEQGYRIEVPKSEASEAVARLQEKGFQKFLCE